MSTAERVRFLACGAALLALTLLATGCRSDDGSSTPAATFVAVCQNAPLPSPGPNQPADPWLRARFNTPASVTVLRPTNIPAGFGTPTLLEACTDAPIGDDGPRYTVIYRGLTNPDDAIVFTLGLPFAEWGNFPGPPTSTESATVRGTNASILVTENVSNQRPELKALMLSWQESDAPYSVRIFTTGGLTKHDLLRIGESLVPVN